MNLLDHWHALHPLHFLRPQWLWALWLLPAALAVGAWRRRRRDDWRAAVDPHLLAHLLQGAGRRGIAGWAAALSGLLLAVLALAGPSWRQAEQPSWQSQTPLVLVLDLSSRIDAPDLPPSRLLQARAKLATLLRERQGGEVALVVYAGEPFTVAPLTDDAANVALFLDALSPDIMPVDGQQAGKALEWADDLLYQSRAHGGTVLLISDSANSDANMQAMRLRAEGHRVSVLGLGTPQGAAYRERGGDIKQARLDEGALRALAVAGGGSYARLSDSDADLQALGVLQPQSAADERPGQATGKAWQDQGYWLLPALMALALLAFRRRRRALAALALCLWLPSALPAHAAEPVGTGWWQRADQRDHQRLAEGVRAYHNGDFTGAQRRFEGIDTAQGWYNLGNALARQGRYDEAIAAYDKALRRQPDMADAKANRDVVDAARKRRQQQQQQQQQQQSQGGGQSGKPESQQGKADGQQQQGQQQSNPQQGQPRDQPRNGQQNGQSSPGQPQNQQQSQTGHAPPPDSPPPKPQNANAGEQQQADQAQRERMDAAMRQQQARDGDDAQKRAAQSTMTREQREQQQAIEAWMQRVPDAPGDLLKAKFRLEYERRRREGQ